MSENVIRTLLIDMKWNTAALVDELADEGTRHHFLAKFAVAIRISRAYPLREYERQKYACDICSMPLEVSNVC